MLLVFNCKCEIHKSLLCRFFFVCTTFFHITFLIPSFLTLDFITYSFFSLEKCRHISIDLLFFCGLVIIGFLFSFLQVVFSMHSNMRMK